MHYIESIEKNFFAVGRYWGNLNSSLTQFGSIWAMNTGVSIPDFNWVWNEKPLTNDNAKSIANIEEIYKKLNLRFWWWVYPTGKSPETMSLLQNAGLQLIEKVPCMAANLDYSALEKQIPNNITISPVEDKSDLLIWGDISFHGFEMPERAREQYGAFVSSFDLGSQAPQKFFLAYFDDKPVATSLLFVHNNTAGIYYVSTLPAYRNKGLGSLITLAAMQIAKKSGFKNVILQASPLGVNVYKRAGFKEYCQAEIYRYKTL
jgi:ribosomal protein S18 acetylase RimI-like enzyme